MLILKTAGAERWFYDNAAKSTQQYIFVTVRDLQFKSDDPHHGSGFRFQQDQGWRFFRCWMLNLYTAIDSAGGSPGMSARSTNFSAASLPASATPFTGSTVHSA